MSTRRVIKVGSRDSNLAMIQTNMVIKEIKSRHPELEFEIVSMETFGDKILDVSLAEIEDSLFAKELEAALLIKEADFCVHSLKDLPVPRPKELVIGCIYKRHDPKDSVLLHPRHKGKSLSALPQGSVLGTSSLRRGAQILRKYPNIKIENIRGSLDARWDKMMTTDDYDGIVLAVSGLQRMGWQDRISHVLPASDCMYAVSQGAMAVECRRDDTQVLQLLQELHHPDTALRVIAERGFLKRLEGGPCSMPVAVETEIREKELYMRGGIFSVDGKTALIDEDSITLQRNASDGFKHGSPQETYVAILAGPAFAPDTCSQAEQLGWDIADRLLKRGGDKILDSLKHIPKTNGEN